MIATEELEHYLGNDLDGLKGRVYSKTFEKLRICDMHTTKEFGLPVLDYLFLAHQVGGRSLRSLSKEVGFPYKSILVRIFDYLSLPRINKQEAVGRVRYAKKCDGITQTIRERIGTGYYPGRLPSIDDLSAELGVATKTVLAAIKPLKEEGLIFSTPRGIHIRENYIQSAI